MVGKNTLIINQAEMVRAINMYFEKLVFSDSQRGYSKIISVRQKGAQLQQVFVIEIMEIKKESKPS